MDKRTRLSVMKKKYHELEHQRDNCGSALDVVLISDQMRILSPIIRRLSKELFEEALKTEYYGKGIDLYYE